MTAIPTIQDLRDGMIDKFMSEYSIALNEYGQAFLDAHAGVMAGELYLMYLAVGKTQKNIWYDTADSVANGGTLERFGVSILARWPFQAFPGVYTASVTGTAGAVISGNMVFKADDNSTSPGALFQITGGDYILTGSGDIVTITALAGGTGSLMTVADTLTGTSPMNNVNAGITIVAQTTAPIDPETIDEYRQKIGEKVQLQPGSWSAADYRLVGTEIAGVKQTYAYPDSGATNEVNVFLQGETAIANPGPSASAGVIAAYTTALELVAPLDTWAIHYASCPINNIDVTITMGSFPPFSTAQKSLIAAGLTSFINNLTPFIAACDTVAGRNDRIYTINLGNVISSAVPGYGYSAATFTVGGTPSVNFQLDNGNICFFNSVTYA